MPNKTVSLIFGSLMLLKISNIYSQQDPQYTQYMFNQLGLNPAYAGSKDVLNLYTLIRNQWVNVDGAPKTLILSGQAPLKNKKVALGIQTFSDKIGPKSIGGLLGSYAYRIRLKNGVFSMGLRYGFYSYKYNLSLIEYKDKTDPAAVNQDQKTVQTGDAGIYYRTQSFYFGFSAVHLIPQKINSYHSTISPHSYITIGKAFQLSENLIFNPSILVKLVKGSKSSDINLNFLMREKIWLGMSIKSNTGAAFLIQFPLSQKFKFGYSIDINTNAIGTGSRGSHEILLQYDLNILKSKTLSPRFL